MTQNLKLQKPSERQLSLLLEYYQAGQFEKAIKFARVLIKDFAETPFVWKVLGAGLAMLSRHTEAADVNRKSIALAPEDAGAHCNYGNSLYEIDRLEDAEESYKHALQLQPNLAGAHEGLARTLTKLGRLDEAQASYRLALDIEPDSPIANYNLGIMLLELGRLKEARESFTRSIKLNPDFAEAFNNLGNTLQEQGEYVGATSSYTKAISIKEDFREAHFNLGIVLFTQKQYDLAAKQFDLCGSLPAKILGLKCLYLLDKQENFYELFDSILSTRHVDAVLGSLCSCSEHKFGRKIENPYSTDPLSQVTNVDLTQVCDFENVFVSVAKKVLASQSTSFKAQGKLTNGVQTAGNIFKHEDVRKTQIYKIICAEVDKYRTHFQNSNEGFIRLWPPSYEIRGWLVCMESGGKLSPHMHDNSWLTGSIYINIPTKLERDSGNLVLCPHDQCDHSKDQSGKFRIIEVETGMLCLFPASLHHYTIPFKAKENRIVLAFDVIPVPL